MSAQAIIIQDSSGPEAFREFLALPRRIYLQDAQYSASSLESVSSGVFRSDFDKLQCILTAARDGQVAARMVVRLSPVLRDDSGQPIGLIGFFEAMNDPETVQALFEHGINWLKRRGAGRIIGPMDGDTWHKYRLNVGPFDQRPFLMEPYNPAYYPDLWVASGFAPLEEYYSKRIDDLSAAAEGTKRFTHRLLSRGYRIRTIDMTRFRDELRLLYSLSCEIFARNFLYTAIPEDEFLALYDGVESLLDPDLVCFAQAPDGKDIGYLFAIPDNFRAIAAMRGERHLLAKLRFLFYRGRTDTVNIKTLGVIPSYQGSGIALSLMNHAYCRSIEKGYRHANMCLIREGNSSGRMDGAQGTLLRRYRLYEFKGRDASPRPPSGLNVNNEWSSRQENPAV
jgi:GNAT superfamily N-acetyltransferase